jgi:hypothetical protein
LHSSAVERRDARLGQEETTMTRTIASEGRTGMMWMALGALVIAGLPAGADAAVRIKSAQSGRSLTIVGDAAANDVSVSYDADADAIDVAVASIPAGAAFARRFAAANVETIKIRLAGGADALSVQLASEGRIGLEELSVDLGPGDEFALVHADPGVPVSVTGGAGQDTTSGPRRPDTVRSVENVLVWTALVNDGGGPRLGYSCSNGTCTCDKSIENDCEDMSGVCTDASIDDLIRCIDGWLTTHCTCKKMLTVRPRPILPTPPVFPGVLTR